MIWSVLCSSFRLTRRAENGTRTRAVRERFRESLQTPPAPGRGVLRSQVPSPLMHRHTKRGKNLSDSSLFWSGKRDSDPRCARAVPRIVADTPGPWKGRFEVAGAESIALACKTKGRISEDSPFCLGAENGTRTRDLNLGKVALYQLSYFRIGGDVCRLRVQR